MKAILINPFDKTVTEVQLTSDFRDIQKAIKAEWFTTVRISRRDYIYVDDEGLLKDLSTQAFFIHTNYPQPLAGIGCVLGCDEEGESMDTTLTLEQVKRAVVFQS